MKHAGTSRPVGQTDILLEQNLLRKKKKKPEKKEKKRKELTVKRKLSFVAGTPPPLSVLQSFARPIILVVRRLWRVTHMTYAEPMKTRLTEHLWHAMVRVKSASTRIASRAACADCSRTDHKTHFINDLALPVFL